MPTPAAQRRSVLRRILLRHGRMRRSLDTQTAVGSASVVNVAQMFEADSTMTMQCLHKEQRPSSTILNWPPLQTSRAMTVQPDRLFAQTFALICVLVRVNGRVLAAVAETRRCSLQTGVGRRPRCNAVHQHCRGLRPHGSAQHINCCGQAPSQLNLPCGRLACTHRSTDTRDRRAAWLPKAKF